MIWHTLLTYCLLTELYKRNGKYKIYLFTIDNHLDWRNHIDQMIPVKHSTLSSKYLLCLISSYNNIWDNFWGVIHPTIKTYLLYKRKLLELWLVQNLELQVKSV